MQGSLETLAARAGDGVPGRQIRRSISTAADDAATTGAYKAYPDVALGAPNVDDLGPQYTVPQDCTLAGGELVCKAKIAPEDCMHACLLATGG